MDEKETRRHVPRWRLHKKPESHPRDSGIFGSVILPVYLTRSGLASLYRYPLSETENNALTSMDLRVSEGVRFTAARETGYNGRERKTKKAGRNRE